MRQNVIALAWRGGSYRPGVQSIPPRMSTTPLRQLRLDARSSAHGAAKESNLPTVGLPRPAGFEDRMGHQTPAARGLILRPPPRAEVLPELLAGVAHLEGAVEVMGLRAVVARLERQRMAAAVVCAPLRLLEEREPETGAPRPGGDDQVGDPRLLGCPVQPRAEVQRAEGDDSPVVLRHEVVDVGVDH